MTPPVHPDGQPLPCPTCDREGSYVEELKGGWEASPRQRTVVCHDCNGEGHAVCRLCEREPAVGYDGDDPACAYCLEGRV